MMAIPPHETPVAPVTVRRGFFWIPGDIVSTPFGTTQRGQMYVEWESPVKVTQPLPLVLIHGGGGMGTDYRGTPDGRPGWLDAFLTAGFAVYIVDRPGHGRSPANPDVLGGPGPQGGYELAGALFASPETGHDQWTWSTTPGSGPIDQVVASMGSMLTDLAEAQRLDGVRLGSLLDLVGPATLVTHSAGAPAGWLAANARPGLVHSIVAVEPMGPPFVDMPGMGALGWGLTSAPVVTEPAYAEATTLGALGGPSILGLDIPVVVVTGSVSPIAGIAAPIVDFLSAVGADAEHLPLDSADLTGNGHGLLFEANSADTVLAVIEWIEKHQR
jgi:pimeloyl-ACP methyl ester carboxylesterase